VFGFVGCRYVAPRERNNSDLAQTTQQLARRTVTATVEGTHAMFSKRISPVSGQHKRSFENIAAAIWFVPYQHTQSVYKTYNFRQDTMGK
jgi:hypothetical protein